MGDAGWCDRRARPQTVARLLRHGLPEAAANGGERHSTNPLERLNGEIKRRTNVVGIVLGERVVTHLVDALLLEQHDGSTVCRRHMTMARLSELCHPSATGPPPPSRRFDQAARKLPVPLQGLRLGCRSGVRARGTARRFDPDRGSGGVKRQSAVDNGVKPRTQGFPRCDEQDG